MEYEETLKQVRSCVSNTNEKSQEGFEFLGGLTMSKSYQEACYTFL